MIETIEIDKKKDWLPGVSRVASPNCDRRPANIIIDLLVIHGINFPNVDDGYGGDYVDALFTNRLDAKLNSQFASISNLRVSAHLFIRRDGKVTQYVPFSMRAWHAGASVFCGRENCNDYSIGIELEGCDEVPYTKAQYQILAKNTLWLMDRWPKIDTDRIVGHQHIAPGRKTDPGPAFDWTYYFSLL